MPQNPIPIQLNQGLNGFSGATNFERVYLLAYDSVSAARKDIEQYINWYNDDRP